VVEARDRGARAFTDSGGGLKDYAERVAKYVPAEIIAAYLFLVPIITATTRPDLFRKGLLLVVLLGLGIFNWPYMAAQAKKDQQPARDQCIVSTFAFAAWTYSIGGFWTEVGLYQVAVGALLLAAVTLIGGLVIPTKGGP
jgi:hypothetical protein